MVNEFWGGRGAISPLASPWLYPYIQVKDANLICPLSNFFVHNKKKGSQMSKTNNNVPPMIC